MGLSPLKSCCLVLTLGLAACGTVSERDNLAVQAQREQQQLADDIVRWQRLQATMSADTSLSSSTLMDLLPVTELEELVKTALAANPNLQRTLLSLDIQSWQLKRAQKAQEPTLTAGLTANKTQEADTLYSSNLTLNWELDLWRQLADAERYQVKLFEQNLALAQASRDSLIATVMKTWLKLVYQHRAIAIETKRLALLETNENLILQRFRTGLGTLEGRDEAATATAKTQANLANLAENLAISQRELALLLGQHTLDPLQISTEYPTVITPLFDMPEQSLQRRPDLRAAYLAIEAADLNTSVAYKDLLPNISLQAALRDSGTSIRDALFISPVWSLIGQLSVPILQQGRLRTAVEIAKLETARSYQAYRLTLLTAVNEVENRVGQENVLAQRQNYTDAALLSAKRNLAQYQQKYRAGLATLSELLSAQQNTFNLEAELDNLIYQRLSNRIDLGLALGLGVDEA